MRFLQQWPDRPGYVQLTERYSEFMGDAATFEARMDSETESRIAAVLLAVSSLLPDSPWDQFSPLLDECQRLAVVFAFSESLATYNADSEIVLRTAFGHMSQELDGHISTRFSSPSM
jgi:hypothetical protein